MSILSRFKKAKANELKPYQRAYLKELRKDENFRNIRAFVTSYNPRTKKRSQVILGRCNNGVFGVWYGGTTL